MRLYHSTARPLTALTLLVALTLSSRSSRLDADTSATPIDVASIDISTMPTAQVEKLKSYAAVSWWGEFGDHLIIGGRSRDMDQLLNSSNVAIADRWENIREQDLKVVIAAHSFDLPKSVKTLTRSGRISLVMSKSMNSRNISHDSSSYLVTNFRANTVYVRAGIHDATPRVWTKSQYLKAKKMMNQVDPVRWYLDVGTLSNWNRHISSVDNVSARDWIKDQLDQLGPTSSILQKFTVAGRDAWNVVATFDAGAASDIYIVCGHYDSISERPSESAPGAEDNATGAAGVVELARIFSGAPRSSTLIFVTFSGEEQGLVGSKAFVRGLDSATRSRIKAVLNMDMIGYSKDDSEDVLLESSSRYKNLVDQYAAAARLVSGLKYYTSYNPYGSDHMPFIDNNIPAILTIDNDWGDYPSYHRSSDTIDKVSRDMGAAILRMNAAALAGMLSLAP